LKLVLVHSFVTSTQSISKTTDSIPSASEIFVVHSKIPSGEIVVLLILISEKTKGASSALSITFRLKDKGSDCNPSESSAVIVPSNSSVASTKGTLKIRFHSSSISYVIFEPSGKFTLYFNSSHHQDLKIYLYIEINLK